MLAKDKPAWYCVQLDLLTVVGEKKKKKVVMEISGFEPEASRMQSERSTTELYPPSHYGTD